MGDSAALDHHGLGLCLGKERLGVLYAAGSQDDCDDDGAGILRGDSLALLGDGRQRQGDRLAKRSFIHIHCDGVYHDFFAVLQA